MEENKANITIDDQNRIRIVEVNVFRESDQLRNDCLEFIKKILNFDESVSGLIDCVDTMAKKVDSQKLRALGEKSRFTSIEDTRNKKVIELTRLLNEKENEFERYDLEYQSLLKIEQEQKQLIEKLINNQMN